MNTHKINEESVQSFTLYRDDIPGFNEIIQAAKSFGSHRGNYNGYAKMKRKWDTILCKEIIDAKISPIDKIFIHMLWCEKNKRRDPDNTAAFIKFILDALQKTGIIKNDNLDYVSGWKNNFIIGENRGVEVKLYETIETSNTEFQREGG